MKPGVGQFPCPCGAQECTGGCGCTDNRYVGVGQATQPTLMDWAMAALAVIGAGTVLYAGYEFIKPSMEGAHENPTIKPSRRSYQAAIHRILRHRYGFSAAKVRRSTNNAFIRSRISHLYDHNYNVAYAADQIHRSVRLDLYPHWKDRGWMPLYRPLPRRGQY